MLLNEFITDAVMAGIAGILRCNDKFEEIDAHTRLNLDTISFDIYVDNNCSIGGPNKLTFSIKIGDKKLN